MSVLFPLHSKVVIISGGRGRLGLEVCKGLARLGATVMPFSRSWVSGEFDDWTNIYPACGDVSSSKQVKDLAQFAHDEFQRIDCVIHMADFFGQDKGRFNPFELQKKVDVSLYGACNLLEAFSPLMQPGGTFIHVVDSYAVRPERGWFGHGVAKAALLALSNAAALELGPYIRSNALLLGPIIPPENARPGLVYEKAGETILDRWGGPDQVTAAIEYLMKGEYITGACLTVDGGQTLK